MGGSFLQRNIVYGGCLRFSSGSDRQIESDGRTVGNQLPESPAPTRCATASACSPPPRPCSAPAVRTPASKRWPGAPASASERSIATFPTREDLFEAVYRREVQQLGELAEALKSEAAPVDALRRWLRSNVEFVATKKGMLAALALAVHGSSELYAYSFDRLTRAVGALLDRAVAAGEIRADISAADLLRALVGMCYMHDQPGWQTSVLRLVDVFVDGLRVQRRDGGPTTAALGDDTAGAKARPPQRRSRNGRKQAPGNKRAR